MTIVHVVANVNRVDAKKKPGAAQAAHGLRL
jgi:hypothetical protein